MVCRSPFWAAAPKGRCPVEHRGEFRDVRPSVLPSVLPSVPPPWPLKPQVCSLRPDFGPLSPQISPFRPQFSPRELKSALQTSYLPSRPQISPPDPKLALQASNQLFRPRIWPLGLKPAPKPQICSFGLDSAILTSSPPQDVSKFPPVSYRTLALWGRCPALTPLLHLITPSRASGTADHADHFRPCPPVRDWYWPCIRPCSFARRDE